MDRIHRSLGVRIVNVARGGVIDDEALKEALDTGFKSLNSLVDMSLTGLVAQAALDVFETEPPSKDNPLINHPKV